MGAGHDIDFLCNHLLSRIPVTFFSDLLVSGRPICGINIYPSFMSLFLRAYLVEKSLGSYIGI